ncbi:hypothetical protein N7495_003918 [Penicillium taxi]|uniref:uncharacterized protein n=1 Tax=Penicillium taxi TaxID=168475 RepID=UPI00254593C6|nr:uncharacterized protein N7495_003918 [Penicillium taxi]KAJ5899174.1 hypothetical protein N7495_003918 [Penicillium taxi]
MAAWLDLSPEATGWTLVDTGRLQNLVESLAHSQSQYPSLVLFIGNKCRVKALQALFPYNNITRRGPSRFVRLHISTETVKDLHPIFFTECNLPKQSGLNEPTERFQRYPMQQKSSSLADMQHNTQVVCFFVDKTADFANIQRLLKINRRKIRVGAKSISDSQHVIIILVGKEIKEEDPSFQEMLCFSEEQPQILVTFLDLRHRHMLSPAAAFEPLRSIIIEHIHITQNEKIDRIISRAELYSQKAKAKTNSFSIALQSREKISSTFRSAVIILHAF